MRRGEVTSIQTRKDAHFPGPPPHSTTTTSMISRKVSASIPPNCQDTLESHQGTELRPQFMLPATYCGALCSERTYVGRERRGGAGEGRERAGEGMARLMSVCNCPDAQLFRRSLVWPSVSQHSFTSSSEKPSLNSMGVQGTFL